MLFVVAALANARAARWRLAQGLSMLALIATVIFGVLVLFHAPIAMQVMHQPWVSHSPVSFIMLMLVSFIALINVSYSRSYMAGNREEEARYLRWLMTTLCAVALVAVTNHMLVFLAAWISISFGLNQLLLFYPQRPRAVLAAHKKFIFARIAELSLFGAFLLLHAVHGSWLISDSYRELHGQPALQAMQMVAVTLLALTALIKCAQFPIHGWLIQVVEAPTPVSALLHAGIINLGGYLLILFAPLLSQCAPAQWLLLVVAGMTTVAAALIMMTRISVKVRLAWSTMSQMGLMLVECALGLYELALLHLVAHSCYKAYAFLNSGSEVEYDLKRRMAINASPGGKDWIVAGLIMAAVIVAVIYVLDIPPPYSAWLLLGYAMTLLLAERNSVIRNGSLIRAFGLGIMLTLAYVVQKQGAGLIQPQLPTTSGWLGDLWVGLLFTALLMLYWLIRFRPDRDMVQNFRIALYAGFYIDEWVTRLTMILFPMKLPVRVNPKQLQIPDKEMIK
ncbi:MAG TPA: NADH-quinone oxidoreductase subunit L [Mariprofundaceae bacterium]|nr:NADH-quinone oxidoreductase subunit L [Mariprofundaceae bacterium]